MSERRLTNAAGNVIAQRPHAPAFHFQYHPTSAIAQWDILMPTDLPSPGCFELDHTASAAAAATARGVLFVALADAAPDASNPSSPNSLCSVFSRVGPVDLTGASAGDPVYLADTAGGFSLTPGTVERQIGTVLLGGASGYFMFSGFPPFHDPVAAP